MAGQIAAKSPTVMRAAKESLNGIDLWDVRRSYRFEQGFTFELNLSGVADEHRDAFVEGRDTDVATMTRHRATEKRMTPDEVVGRLRSGMTVGIGGWGSRRKPMALVRALLRSDVTDLHVVTYGGPEVGILAAAGRIRRLTFAFVSPDVANPTTGGSVPGLDPHFRAARQAGALASTEVDEGMLLLGLQAAAWRVPFLPTRVGLGSDLFRLDPDLRTVRSPYPGPDGGRGRGAGGPARHRTSTPPSSTSTWATPGATPPSPVPTSTSTTCCWRPRPRAT